MKLIELNIEKIKALCRRYKVNTLAVFGSILTDRFSEHSDVDLLVDFKEFDHQKEDYVTNYFNLKESLENLLGREVDLIEYGGIRNPLFKKSVDSKKVMIFG